MCVVHVYKLLIFKLRDKRLEDAYADENCRSKLNQNISNQHIFSFIPI